MSLSLCIEFKRLLLNFFLAGPERSESTSPLVIKGAGRAWIELNTSPLLLRCAVPAGQEETIEDHTKGR